MATARGNIRILAWFNFLSDFRLYSPVAVIYYAKVCGSYAAGMAVFSAAMLSSVLFELPTGILSDRVGRRATLLLGQAAALSAVIVYAVAPNAAVLYAGAALEGLGRAFFSGNNNALLFDSLKDSGLEGKFHHYLGRLSSAFQVALALSALAGSALAGFSLRLALGLSVLPQAAALLLAFLVKEPARAGGKAAIDLPGSWGHFKISLKLFFTNKRLRAVSLANAVSNSLGESCFQFSAAFMATLWPLWAIGVSKLLSNAGAALSFRLSGRLIDRFGAFPVLIASRAFGRVAGILASLFPGPASPLVISSSSLCFGTATVSSETIVQGEFSDEQRATMGSIGSMLESLFFAAASPLLGLAADRAGPAKAFLWAQAIMVIPMLALMLEMRRGRKSPLRST